MAAPLLQVRVRPSHPIREDAEKHSVPRWLALHVRWLVPKVELTNDPTHADDVSFAAGVDDGSLV